jgi:hypothetical protein
MLRTISVFGALALAASAWCASKDADMPARWQYAGESKGIRFRFRIANECADAGARMEVKLENTLDAEATVSFRIVDPDWKRSFERKLGPKAEDASIRFAPDEGTACHPYVDEVYLESRDTQVSRSDADAEEAETDAAEAETGSETDSSGAR